MNGLRHGLRAETAVLPSEDSEEFDQHRQALEAEFQPVGRHERLLVDDIVLAAWRLERARMVCSSQAGLRFSDAQRRAPSYRVDSEDAFGLLGLAYDCGLKTQEHISRIEGRFRAAFYRAVATLERVQLRRQLRESKKSTGQSTE